ncbi:MAG: hypothetical protein ACUVXA_11815 [Candidatus Jordarchaeum sp.]|uniref:hypothetical protein n=1 Tax=Candidatus Jordarchaeum sp. TaxID=2823881 RepID=UPI00404AD3B4
MSGEAERIVSDAKNKADSILEVAKKEAENIVLRAKEVAGEVRREREKTVRRIVRNLLINNVDEVLKGLISLTDLDVQQIFVETEKIVNAYKGHDSIDKLPVIIRCSKCSTEFFLDSEIEEELVETERQVFGSFACPNCNALSKYEFTQGKVVGTMERGLPENKCLGFKSSDLRKRVEELLTPLFNEVVKFGETRHSIMAIPLVDKCRIILRHIAKKKSDEEKWETEWNSRLKAEINTANVCNIKGEINFQSKRESAIGPITYGLPLRIEKSHVLSREDLDTFAGSLANIFSEINKEATLNVLSLLEQAPLVLEWMRPLKRVMAFAPSEEMAPLVSELEEKIKERKEKKEKEPLRI